MSTQNGHSNHAEFYTPPTNVDNAELRFMREVEKEHNKKFTNYEEFYRWTCDSYPEFWQKVLDFCDIRTYSKYTQLVEDKPIEEIPKWFVGATTNYADNCLKNGHSDKVAFIQASPNRTYTSYTYAQLNKDVASVAGQMKEFGLKSGDRVCAYLPNCYEATVAMLAVASCGGTWSSASTDFGPAGVLDRFQQVKPKILLATNEITFKQKVYSLVNNVNEIVEGLSTLEKVVVVRRINKSADLSNLTSIPKDKLVLWEDLLGKEDAALEFYSVHIRSSVVYPILLRHYWNSKMFIGGMLLKHAEEHILQTNFSGSDTVFFYTTTGWMMWQWLMSVLITGATIVLYEESPLEPDPHILLKIAADTKTTALGMGAKIYDEYQKMNVDFKSLYDLTSLRLILSTASPLKASTFDFINSHIRPQVVIGSISGGTDIVGCFMGGTLNRPVVPGECQHYYLGMDMAALDEDGNEVVDDRGELVCRKPFPNGERYKQAYFNKFNGVWTHGDFVLYNSKTNGQFIFGRSDTTLNRSGVRIGTSELYAIVEKFTEISDSIVVGQKDPEDDSNELIILFVKMAENAILNDQLKMQIKVTLRQRVSPRHVPDEVFIIQDIPYTASGKKVELAVKQTINGEIVKNINSLRNPDALDLYKKFVRKV
ncbi:Acetoacetyl-CoA synthetase [Aphelenchoides bicaudatus]|nr:Acetoacetyl-CoA synthetase [Aphelenchoides bicaudatus]